MSTVVELVDYITAMTTITASEKEFILTRLNSLLPPPIITSAVVVPSRVQCSYILPRKDLQQCKRKNGKLSEVYCTQHYKKVQQQQPQSPPPSSPREQEKLEEAPYVEHIPVEVIKQPYALHKLSTDEKELLPHVEEKEDECLCIVGKNKPCGRPLKPTELVCSTHHRKAEEKVSETLKSIPIPRVKWIHGEFWDALVQNGASVVPEKKSLTRGLVVSELMKDNDSKIDDRNARAPFRPYQCVYVLPEQSTEKFLGMCGKPPVEGSHLCKEHRGHSKEFPYYPISHVSDSLNEAMRPFPEYNTITRSLWFTRLHLACHVTREGPIVVGKAWLGGMYIESLRGEIEIERGMDYSSLTEGETFEDPKREDRHRKYYAQDNNVLEPEDNDAMVRRCHNNGLLYKILPQSIAHRSQDLPEDLNTVHGAGFTSFEQMIAERPSLYVKYWKVWNGHLARLQEFRRYYGFDTMTLNKHLGIDIYVDWKKYFGPLGIQRGLGHVLVPPPSLEQVSAAEGFNPFRYCHEWVQANCPERAGEPHYPPMYVLYPFPDSQYQEKYYKNFGMSTEQRVRAICAVPRLVQHYHLSSKTGTPQAWVQWLRYGRYENQHDLFSLPCYDVPIDWRERIGRDRF